MESLLYSPMGKKDEYIRIRSDEDLKLALKQAADRSDRKESDQARYLLRLALGLIDDEEAQIVRRRIKAIVPVEPDSSSHKRGHHR